MGLGRHVIAEFWNCENAQSENRAWQRRLKQAVQTRAGDAARFERAAFLSAGLFRHCAARRIAFEFARVARTGLCGAGCIHVRRSRPAKNCPSSWKNIFARATPNTSKSRAGASARVRAAKPSPSRWRSSGFDENNATTNNHLLTTNDQHLTHERISISPHETARPHHARAT